MGIPMGHPMGINMGIPMGVPMGIPLGFRMGFLLECSFGSGPKINTGGVGGAEPPQLESRPREARPKLLVYI